MSGNTGVAHACILKLKIAMKLLFLLLFSASLIAQDNDWRKIRSPKYEMYIGNESDGLFIFIMKYRHTGYFQIHMITYCTDRCVSSKAYVHFYLENGEKISLRNKGETNCQRNFYLGFNGKKKKQVMGKLKNFSVTCIEIDTKGECVKQYLNAEQSENLRKAFVFIDNYSL